MSAPVGDGRRMVDPVRLEALVAAMLGRVGLNEGDATLLAEALVLADLRGMSSHGILRLPVYVRRLQMGGFAPHGEARVLRESAATVLLDGRNGLGALLTRRAMERAIAKAREAGIAAVGIRNSNHNGEGAFHVLPAIAAEMIGIATSNGSPIMPVYGGRRPFTAPLPVTIGVPANEVPPILLDMALGMSSRGKILDHAERGVPLPAGWMVDADGRPTTDASWIKHGGWMLPIGGHKGFGLILMCEILSGLLTGGRFGKELVNLYDDLDRPQGNGQFVIAIDIGAFVDVGAFKARVDEVVRMMKAEPLAEGVDEILMPGEIEFRREADQRARGARIAAKVVDEVIALAGELGLESSL